MFETWNISPSWFCYVTVFREKAVLFHLLGQCERIIYFEQGRNFKGKSADIPLVQGEMGIQLGSKSIQTFPLLYFKHIAQMDGHS